MGVMINILPKEFDIEIGNFHMAEDFNTWSTRFSLLCAGGFKQQNDKFPGSTPKISRAPVGSPLLGPWLWTKC